TVFDFGEFAIGIILGLIIGISFFKLAPWWNEIAERIQAQIDKLNINVAAGAREKYRLEVLIRAQTMHLARVLFALDEIAVEPTVLAPPYPTDPLDSEPAPETTLAVVPNLLDWTYLSGVYQSPSIPIGHALDTGANILIVGQPGIGKSTALAYTASMIANHDPAIGKASEKTPVFIHAADLGLHREGGSDPLKDLVAAVQLNLSPNVGSRMSNYLQSRLGRGVVLLILDGLDEYPIQEMKIFSHWLETFQQKYPGNQILAAGPDWGFDGLVQAGMTPLALAPWSEQDLRTFLKRWELSWQEHIVPTLSKKKLSDIDPALLSGWLMTSARGLTPLEATLLTWAAYTGDIRGGKATDSIEAYLNRMLSNDEQKGAEEAAFDWIKEGIGPVPERVVRRAPVNDLIEAGIMLRHADNVISFTQPSIGAYLAALGMLSYEFPEEFLLSDQVFGPLEQTLQYFAAMGDISDLVQKRVNERNDPLRTALLASARYLRDGPKKAPWRTQLLRELANIASSSDRSYGLRLRSVHALAYANEPTVNVLFQRLLKMDHPSNRILGALGLGGLRDGTSVELLSQISHGDQSLLVRQAACLALAAIGSEPALETLGRHLLQGEEQMRLCAAEALAIHPDEGFAMLREAIDLEHVLTRRAAVFGLLRVHARWARDILHTLQVEDDQWVVRGAASEAIERLHQTPWKIPQPINEVADLPWLVAFAGREGYGVAPGRAGIEMVRRALLKGNDEEKIAAIETIAWATIDDLGPELNQALYSPEAHLRDVAFETLWFLTSAGFNLVHTPSSS
ncbi:MAG: HEAT repeat domain-containing protein, partial [Anaerolineales bacterium]